MNNKNGMMLKVGIAILAIIVIIVVYAFSKYNGLVTKEETISAQWAQVENQLQRRFDLIPNLVETAKAYAKHEEELFTQLAEARSEYSAANSVEEMSAANDELSAALSKLMVIVEAYPELKSNEQFTILMTELAGAENRIAVARKDYNEAVQDFNSTVRRAPGSIIAGMFGFEQKDYFEVKDGVEETPTVDFGSD